MKVTETNLPGVFVVEPRVFGDSRGKFFESYSYEKYQQAGIDLPFVQDNISHSVTGVLRGLHYQLKHPQGKLVSVLAGSVFDVAVDIRIGSPTFGQWFGCELSESNGKQLYVPPGFAHGFCVLSETVCFMYKCTDYYHPEDEQGIAWNDPDLNISWWGEGSSVLDLKQEPVLSDKDKKYLALKNTPVDLLPVFQK